jgi:hypothetical protein
MQCFSPHTQSSLDAGFLPLYSVVVAWMKSFYLWRSHRTGGFWFCCVVAPVGCCDRLGSQECDLTCRTSVCVCHIGLACLIHHRLQRQQRQVEQFHDTGLSVRFSQIWTRSLLAFVWRNGKRWQVSVLVFAMVSDHILIIRPISEFYLEHNIPKVNRVYLHNCQCNNMKYWKK